MRFPGVLLSSLLLASLAVAGCSDEAPLAQPDVQHIVVPTGLPALEMPWVLTQCRFAVILVDVPAADVQPFVPEGFRVLSSAEVGIEGQAPADVPNPRSDGNFGLEVFDCEEGTGLDGETIPGMAYSSFFTGVDPPADLRQDVNNHFVKWDVLVPDEARRSLLQSYGIAAHNGTATASFTLAEGPLALYSGAVDSEGMGSFAFQGTAGAPLPAGSFAEFTATPGGLATWTMEYELTAGGAGLQTVTIPAGTWAAEVVGAGQHQGAGFAGIATFTGSLSLPAQPAQAAGPATQPS